MDDGSSVRSPAVDAAADALEGALDAHSAPPVVRAGVDLVAISRVRDLLDEFGDGVRERVFTPDERRYCESRGHPAQHYAARWAAKEAFAKVLADDVPAPPRSAVGVARAANSPDSPDSPDSPAPELDLDPVAADALDRALAVAGADPSLAATSLSLSHDREADRAVAQLVVVAVRRGDGPP